MADKAEIIAKAEAEHDYAAILKLGVETWNRWRSENKGQGPIILAKVDLSEIHVSKADLSEVDLSEANLSRADLSQADLTWAKFREANLRQANLSGAYLSQANFGGAYLSQANLSQANLSGAFLRGADLIQADLSGADLSGADLIQANLLGAYIVEAELSKVNLRSARIGNTSFENVDLSTVRGLETVRHVGRSYIDMHTIYCSHGKIPETFLRGVGLPDEFIAYIPSLVAQPIQFYSCFISYSTKDQDFAERLHADLQDKGVRCWFAPEDVQGGRKLHEQIDEAIRRYDKLLVVLSQNSMNSEWVKTEIYHARQDEIRRNCRKLFPVSLAPFETIRAWQALDADTGKDMGREVREYFIPDFSNWKDHDAYQKAFARLLRDLKADAKAKATT
jgi:uncharacterized protein YjbI with pentapeptide repeats